MISTPAAPAAIGPYSQAVKVGKTVWLSGQIPLVPGTTELVCEAGVTAQYFACVTEYPECVTAPVINFYN